MCEGDRMKVRLQIGKNRKGLTDNVYSFEGESHEIIASVDSVYRGLVEEAIKSYGVTDNATTVTYRMQLPQEGKGPRCVIVNVQGKTGKRQIRAGKGTHVPYGGWEPDSMI